MPRPTQHDASSHQCLLSFRAIYFAAYSKSKEVFNGLFVPNSGLVHMSSAGAAGECCACFLTVTNVMKCLKTETGLWQISSKCFLFHLQCISTCLGVIKTFFQHNLANDSIFAHTYSVMGIFNCLKCFRCPMYIFVGITCFFRLCL